MIKGKIAIKDRGAIKLIDVGEIIAVEEDVYQCTFYLENGEKHYRVQSLKVTLSLLPADSFMQVRRDAVINLNHIVEVKDNKIYMKLGREYAIPYRKRKKIKNMLLKPDIHS